MKLHKLSSLPTIPEKLEDWNIDTVNGLITVKDVEGEQFDFKKDIDSTDKLSNHICAMANTSGGYIVIGVGEEQTSSGLVLGFKKYGFKQGEQDKINQTISNNLFGVDPIPKIKIVNISEGNKFYPVIKIESEESKKPFFTKDRGQCYIRVGNTSQPASRSFILNLIQRHIVTREELHNHTKYLRTNFELLTALNIFDDRYLIKRIQVPNNYNNYRINVNLGLFDSKIRQDYPYDYVNLTDIPHMDWVFSHLQTEEYEIINGQYLHILELVNKYNRKILLLQKTISLKFKNLMNENFPSLHSLTDSNFENTNNSFYDIEKLSFFLLRRLKASLEYKVAIDYSDLKVENVTLKDAYYIEARGIGVLLESYRQGDLDVEKLKQIFGTIYDGVSVNKGLNDLIALEKKFDKKRNAFREAMKQLVTDFDGGDVVKGYCKLGF